MANLQEIADSILGRLGAWDDHEMRERVKKDLLYSRTEIIRRQLEKKKIIPKSWIDQLNCQPTIRVDVAECCSIKLGCSVTRTLNKIPEPVKGLMNTDFSFVGTIDGKTAFSASNPEDVDEALSDRWVRQTNPTFYSYINNYIYLFNGFAKDIRIRGVFSDLELVQSLNSCNTTTDDSGGTCDLADITIEDDLAYLMKDLTYRQLGVALETIQAKEVESEKQIVNND